MRFISFTPDSALHLPRYGVLDVDGQAVLELSNHPTLPGDLLGFIAAGPPALVEAAEAVASSALASHPLRDITLLPPLPRPNSLRDFYAFEQHVATAHANRGRAVPPEWYEIPVFYFSNPFSAYGPEAAVPRPRYTNTLDYELEVAAIIGTAGRDLQPENALEHIFGFTIFNDWSARDIQRKEMKVGLGPAKGKDFASSFGPAIVTPDELTAFATGRPGVYNLAMVARVNGEVTARGNWADIHFDFGQLLARASDEVMLYPGDIIGSGTVGTGCLLETTRGQGPWLEPGDVVELEIEQLGILSNTII